MIIQIITKTQILNIEILDIIELCLVELSFVETNTKNIKNSIILNKTYVFIF